MHDADGEKVVCGGDDIQCVLEQRRLAMLDISPKPAGAIGGKLLMIHTHP